MHTTKQNPVTRYPSRVLLNDTRRTLEDQRDTIGRAIESADDAGTRLHLRRVSSHLCRAIAAMHSAEEENDRVALCL